MRSCLTLLVILATVVPAAAQAPTIPRSDPDFFFARPQGSITFRGSLLFFRGESDWYDFVTETLTLEPKDFRGPGFGIDVTFPVASRLDVQGSFDVNVSRSFSEYRGFTDTERLPIEQTTLLREINLGANLKFALTERLRQVSRLVWVPRRIVPFVGGGAGIVNYKLEQRGDFVDFQDFSVFSDLFFSDGWAPSAQVMGGVDVHVFKRVNLTVDGRYHWGAADLRSDWIGFEPIDLSGFRMSGGVSILFF